MLTLDRLSKVFHRDTANEVTAIDAVELALAPGDFVAIIGSNGAGKSTLIKSVAGLVDPDEGRIVFDGRDITGWPVHRRAGAIGRIAQDPGESTCAVMTIAENLAMAEMRGRRRGLAIAVRRDGRERYRAALEPIGLGLEGRLDTRVGQLSGGQRQALALLMATLSGSKLLLLDEHLASLDPRTAEIVMALTGRLVAGRRLTTLMVTHNMEHALRWGNRLVMMHGGRIVFEAAGDQKAGLDVQALVEKFHWASRGEMADDRLLLRS